MIPLDKLIQNNALQHSAAYPFGSFAVPVNLSATTPGAQGLPTGWAVRGPVSGNGLTNFLQKAGGVPIVLSSFVGPDVGSLNQTIIQTTRGVAMSWSDGPSGHVTGSSDVNIAQYTADMYDGGFDIKVPCKQWPDWQLLRLYTGCFGNRSEEYIASIDDPATTLRMVEIKQNSSPQINGDWINTTNIVTEFLFCSRAPGRTLNIRLRTTYEYFCGIQAVQLFDAVSPSFQTGGLSPLVSAGHLGPLGSR